MMVYTDISRDCAKCGKHRLPASYVKLYPLCEDCTEVAVIMSQVCSEEQIISGLRLKEEA